MHEATLCASRRPSATAATRSCPHDKRNRVQWMYSSVGETAEVGLEDDGQKVNENATETESEWQSMTEREPWRPAPSEDAWKVDADADMQLPPSAYSQRGLGGIDGESLQRIDEHGHEENDEGSDASGLSSELGSEELQVYEQMSCIGVIKHLGPAFIVSIGYLDPGNWAANLESGSRFGYMLLWVLVLSTSIGVLFQYLSAKLGAVTEQHLAELCAKMYPRRVSIALWLMAELAIAALDLAQVVGISVGLEMLFGAPPWLGVLIASADTLMLIGLRRSRMKRIENTMLVFMVFISLSFVVELVLSRPDVLGMVKGTFIPYVSRKALFAACVIVGATVTPNNFYLHSAIVIHRVPTRTEDSLRLYCRYQLVDSAVALSAACLINMAILTVAAANFWRHGVVVTTLQQAYDLLETFNVKLGPIEVAAALFGLALVASGLGTALSCTLAGQYVMQGFLGRENKAVPRRVITRLLTLAPTLVAMHIYGTEGSYLLLIYTQVLISLQLPFAMIPLVRLTGAMEVMGEHFKNGPIVQLFSWASSLLIIGLNVSLTYDTMFGGDDENAFIVPSWVKYGLLTPFFSCSAALLVFILVYTKPIAATVRLENELFRIPSSPGTPPALSGLSPTARTTAAVQKDPDYQHEQ
ncbi:Natural resistance-associated macrophage protein 2-like [Porphyridium purpureum]|uniref:Natural resistance-associated macrophage protein 2-like n=1 Tax=Porphyridium purpureum TaxID=35688 RepID=A0A5J4Z5P2_PORPP|nr:Natural resistance-associated macrophage protein 2-like [Porphyridium purpureum]|eukprot:POR8293..scf295_1